MGFRAWVFTVMLLLPTAPAFSDPPQGPPCATGWVCLPAQALELRDRRGLRIGRIVLVDNGTLEARDYKGLRVGKFYPDSNQTRDVNGRLVGTGFLLTRLIPARD